MYLTISYSYSEAQKKLVTRLILAHGKRYECMVALLTVTNYLFKWGDEKTSPKLMKPWIFIDRWPFQNTAVTENDEKSFSEHSLPRERGTWRRAARTEMNNSVSETHRAALRLRARSLPAKLFSFVSGGGGGSGGAGVVCDLIIISLLITIECASLFIACARSRLNRNKQRLQLVKTRVILSNICSVLALGIYLQIN
jgi:hypothetical protein